MNCNERNKGEVKFEVQGRMGQMEEQHLAEKVNVSQRVKMSEDSLRRIGERENLF